ncbi:hypothetical protein BD309DRAFT_961644 [Dichomitus squalens]|nr:hypothetical protein BD309DRAFT_961644 [Dichomitus squalens]
MAGGPMMPRTKWCVTCLNTIAQVYSFARGSSRDKDRVQGGHSFTCNGHLPDVHHSCTALIDPCQASRLRHRNLAQ